MYCACDTTNGKDRFELGKQNNTHQHLCALLFPSEWRNDDSWTMGIFSSEWLSVKLNGRSTQNLSAQPTHSYNHRFVNGRPIISCFSCYLSVEWFSSQTTERGCMLTQLITFENTRQHNTDFDPKTLSVTMIFFNYFSQDLSHMKSNGYRRI